MSGLSLRYRQLGRAEDHNRFDSEYAAALYMLTADQGTWQWASSYVMSMALTLTG